MFFYPILKNIKSEFIIWSMVLRNKNQNHYPSMEDKLIKRPERNYQGAIEIISPLAITTSTTR